jgi:uncharacterized protein YdhG (YjbR/CyaY superfamily)
MKTNALNPQSIDEYIASFPPAVQTLLQRVRAAIQRAAPRATETIKYRLPTFVLHGNLVHFGAFTHHIGFYALPSGNAKFRTELAKYPSGKGSIQFPLDRPIPFALIGRIVKFRAQENIARAAAKQPKLAG